MKASMCCLIALTFLWLPLSAARAGEGVEPFSLSPRELAAWPDGQEVESDTDVHMLLRQDSIILDEQGRSEFTIHRIFRLLTAAGVEAESSVARRWNPWHQAPPLIEARVVTRDGEERRLDPATISEQAADETRHSLRRVSLAPLPGVEVGAVVEVRVVVKDLHPALPGSGTQAALPIAFRVPTDRARLEVTAPEGVPVHQKLARWEGAAPTLTAKGGLKRWVLEFGPLPAEDSVDPLLPPEVESASRWAISSGASWSAVAGSYHELVETALKETPTAVTEVVASLADEGSTESRVAALVAWMHRQVRLDPMVFGSTPLAPRSPAETLQRGVGESKDLAALLVSLLRTAEIPAHVVLVSGGLTGNADPTLPGTAVFDRVLVALPIATEEHFRWIDPTSRYARPGALTLAVQGQWALVIGPETEALVQIPESAVENNFEREVRRLTLTSLGPARLEEMTEVGGQTELEYRDTFAGLSLEETRERLAGYAGEALNAPALTAWETSDPEDLSRPFTVRVTAEESYQGYTDLSEAVVALPVDEVLYDLPTFFWEEAEEDEEGEPRQWDFFLYEPYRAEVTYRVSLPPGYRPRELPEPLDQRWGPARFERIVTAEDDVVEVVHRFAAGTRRFSPDEAETLRQGVLEVAEEGELRIHFDNIAEAHLAAGEFREALADLEPRLVEHPEEALLHVRKARVLLAAGLGQAAREEMNRAAELAPELPLIQTIKGIILQHDSFGRILAGDFDHPGATAAFRRALELEPEETQYFSNLAVHLEHNQDGFQRGPGAYLEEAVEVLKRHREVVGDSELDINLAADLFLLERFDECQALLDEVETSVQGEAIRVAIVAATQGAEAALEKAAGLSSAEQRSGVLSAALELLLNSRHYPPVAALGRSMAAASPNGAEVLAQMAILSKAQRHEERPLPEDPLEALIHRLFRLIFLEDGAEVLTLFSPRLGEDRFEQAEEEWHKVSSSFRRMAESGGVDLILDLTLGVLQIETEEAPVGYRVSLHETMGASGLPGFYAVEDDGELHVLAAFGQAHVLGGEALRGLAQEPPHDVRPWLNWGRGEFEARLDADDPLAGSFVARLWQVDQEATEDEIRLAAAALAASGSADDGKPEAEAAVPILEGAWKTFEIPEGGPLPAGDVGAVAAALASAYGSTERWRELGELAHLLLEYEPVSTLAFLFRAQAAEALGDWSGLREAAAARLEILPDDSIALRAIALADAGLGDWEAALDGLRLVLESDGALAVDFNQLAWYQLLAGQASEETIELAQRSVADQSAAAAVAELHTLATTYAVLDRPTEAVQVLHQLLQFRFDPDLEPADWFIIGRIAESYGLEDYARASYRRCEGEDSPSDRFLGTPVLARQRLRVLAERDALD